MPLANFAGFYLAVLFATPTVDKWDFKPHGKTINRDGARVLAITKAAITVVQFDDKSKIATYPLHLRLAHGSFNMLDTEIYCYSREDVKLGDVICMRILKGENKVEYCLSISIWERPEGKVPPTRRYMIGDWHPWHEQAEAFRKFEKDGTPIPYHLIKGKKCEFPAFDPRLPRKDRLKPWPSIAPFTYIEFALFLR